MAQPKRTRITYSDSVDALAISFQPRPAGRPITHDLGRGIWADFIGDTLVGFEILDASALIPKAALATIGPPGEDLNLAEAAAEAKRQPQTIRKAIARGAIREAKKRGRDWFIPRYALWNYLSALEPVGRPPKDRRAPRGKRVRAR